MLNPEVLHNTSSDVIFQISSYFDIVDQAIQMADTNKHYRQVVNDAQTPIINNAETRVNISPTKDNMADVYNGYIYGEMKLNIRINQTAKIPAFTATKALTNPHRVWVGFKSARDLISQYEIHSNGERRYGQANAIEESFIISCATTEEAKKSDLYSYSRHVDVWAEKADCFCGAYINLDNKDIVENLIIKFKIDLRKFLVLAGIKYLPKFVGKMEIMLTFSTEALVCTPVDPFNCIKDQTTYTVPPVTNEFVPIGKSFTMITGYDSTTKTFTAGTRSLSVEGDYRIDQLYSMIYEFGLMESEYNKHKLKYSQSPLTFSGHALSFIRMRNPLTGIDAVSGYSIAPKFFDSIGMLFPSDTSHTTCYRNPFFKWFQLTASGYGAMPTRGYGTDREPRLLEEIQNALNLNSDTTGLNKDVLRALTTNMNGDAGVGYKSNDLTNFLVMFPTEPDFCFQQGHTSENNVDYVVTVRQDEESYYYQLKQHTPPWIFFLVDATFSIQVRPDVPAEPIIEIGAYDATTPVYQ